MFKNCPHCFTKVVPMSDGKCPSCQNNINEPPEGSEKYTKITIKQTQVLPGICAVCGEATSKTKSIKVSKNTDATDGATTLAAFVLFSWLGLLISAIFGGAKQSFKIKLPVCKKCHYDKKTNPEYVNFDKRSIDFVTHKNFIESL